jgi:hypothetical protein
MYTIYDTENQAVLSKYENDKYEPKIEWGDDPLLDAIDTPEAYCRIFNTIEGAKLALEDIKAAIRHDYDNELKEEGYDLDERIDELENMTYNLEILRFKPVMMYVTDCVHSE